MITGLCSTWAPLLWDSVESVLSSPYENLRPGWGALSCFLFFASASVFPPKSCPNRSSPAQAQPNPQAERPSTRPPKARISAHRAHPQGPKVEKKRKSRELAMGVLAWSPVFGRLRLLLPAPSCCPSVLGVVPAVWLPFYRILFAPPPSLPPLPP